jgi:hypothetical protein
MAAVPTLEGLLNSANPQTVVTGANLNALSSGSFVLGAAFSNVTADGKGGGFPWAYAQLHLDSMTVSAGGAVSGWFLTAPDGSTYEQGGTGVQPNRPFDFNFTPVAQTAAVDVDQLVRVPICANIKVLLWNNSLGAATPSNTNGYLKLWYVTEMLPTV